MNACRLHITGASGTGTTTLGRRLAEAWSVPHADTDDYFWLPSVPPYTTKRDQLQRLALMEEVFLPRPAWVLSGSLMGWGDRLKPRFEAVIFMTADPALRLARLERRELHRRGDAIAPGGPQEADHRAFLEWAAGYDDPTFDGRSRTRHERWLATLDCPLLRLDGGRPLDELLASVVAWNP